MKNAISLAKNVSTISLNDMSCQDQLLKQEHYLRLIKKMSPLFCSDLFASLDQRSSEKKTFTYPGEHNNFIGVNRSYTKRIHPSRHKEIVCVHRFVGLHLSFCSPRGLQYQIVHNIWILNLRQKLDIFREITFSQRIWVEATNSYFFLVPQLRWPHQTRKIIRILNVYIGNAPCGSHF